MSQTLELETSDFYKTRNSFGEVKRDYLLCCISLVMKVKTRLEELVDILALLQ